jgi:hypothetical protein
MASEVAIGKRAGSSKAITDCGFEECGTLNW